MKSPSSAPCARGPRRTLVNPSGSAVVAHPRNGVGSSTIFTGCFFDCIRNIYQASACPAVQRAVMTRCANIPHSCGTDRAAAAHYGCPINGTLGGDSADLVCSAGESSPCPARRRKENCRLVRRCTENFRPGRRCTENLCPEGMGHKCEESSRLRLESALKADQPEHQADVASGFV